MKMPCRWLRFGFLAFLTFSTVFLSQPTIVQAEGNFCCPAGFVPQDGSVQAIQECGSSVPLTTVCCKQGQRVAATQCKASSAITCNWTSLNNANSSYNGKPTFCLGGFNTKDELKNSQARFVCNGNCGSIALRAFNAVFRGDGQTVPLNSVPDSDIGTDQNGKYFTCISGDFDSSIKDVANSYIQKQTLGCGVLTGLSLAGIPGGLLFDGVIAAGACALADNTVFSFNANFIGSVQDSTGANVCSDSGFKVKFENNVVTNDKQPPPAPGGAGATGVVAPVSIKICDQIPLSAKNTLGGSLRSSCQACIVDEKDPKGVFTAVGCIPTNGSDIVSSLIKLGLGIAGGTALIMIIVSGLMFSVSQGDPKRTTEARDLFTSAIIGLVFIILSVTILQFVGINILRIPGFGDM